MPSQPNRPQPAAGIALALAGEAATAELAEDIAAIARPGDVIGLSGDLGAGKTTFARAFLRSLAGDETLTVPSPSFTLVQPYALREAAFHFDLYRIGGDDELVELGFDEAAETGIVLVEWPERAPAALDRLTILISFEDAREPAGNGRHVTIRARPEAAARIERSLAARAFLRASGLGQRRRHFLLGDASTRAYERLAAPDVAPLILMNAPARPDGPPVRGGKPYSQIAHLAEDVVPFVAVGRWLVANGLAAPQIHAADLDSGFLVVEDLGGETVVAEGEPVPERYEVAIEALAHLHSRPVPQALPVSGRPDYRVPDYDAEAMAIETDLLIDWYLPHQVGRAAGDDERRRYAELWRSAFSAAGRSERHLVLRDYHSPNLIWRGDRTGLERLGIIDFQDAVIGPSAYDVASLVQDARVAVDQGLEAELVDAYVRLRGRDGTFDEPAFRRALAIMEAQRASKVLGIFVRLKERDGKPGYLRHLPRIRGYLARALMHEDLADLRRWYLEAGVLEGTDGEGA